jgi:hypothetical protein
MVRWGLGPKAYVPVEVARRLVPSRLVPSGLFAKHRLNHGRHQGKAREMELTARREIGSSPLQSDLLPV